MTALRRERHGREAIRFTASLLLCFGVRGGDRGGDSVRAQTPLIARVTPAPVYVESLLTQIDTGQGGYALYEPRPATLSGSGKRLEHSLITAVGSSGVLEQTSILVLHAADRYQTLLATVGREEAEAAKGPAWVYFEVWGDGKRLYRSAALGAISHSLRIGPGMKVRKTPEEVSVSLRGVTELRLITRYASDIAPQTGTQTASGRGCVWGDVRLLPALPETPANRNREISRTAAQGAVNPLRDALRTASAVIAAGTINWARSASPPYSLPLRLAVVPLRQEEDRTQSITGKTGTADSEEKDLRATLLEFLSISHTNTNGDSMVFRPVDRRAAGRIASAFPSRRPERDEATSLVESGRKAGADVVVTGVYRLHSNGGDEGRIELIAVDTRTSGRIASTSVALVTSALIEPSERSGKNK